MALRAIATIASDLPDHEDESPLAEPSSFRDPSGFVFVRGGTLYRQVNPAGSAAYARLMGSGLYEALASQGMLIAHEEVDLSERMTDEACYVLRPERIPFVSYTYEWCFTQLQDAALLTLGIQREALRLGMSLKDASAHNIQFRGCQTVHIDTLSFESYVEGTPWVAYRQFCQHFLAPLALMCYDDIRLGQILRSSIDGIPVDLAARLLPLRARFDTALLPHIFLHQAAQRRHADDGASGKPTAAKNGAFSRTALLGLLDSLESGIRRLTWTPRDSEWGDYYEGGTNYDSAAFAAKRETVARLIGEIDPKPSMLFDLGANTGLFSRIASDQGIPTIALDVDPAAVERGYRDCRAKKTENLLPLVQDLTNPSPSLGWAQSERKSLLERCAGAERGGVTAALALALVHHLAIGNNVPLPRVADFFAQIAEHLVIEWVPKEDSQVRRLLATRQDIFPDYTESGFERAFAARFVIERREPIAGTKRTIYRLRRRIL